MYSIKRLLNNKILPNWMILIFVMTAVIMGMFGWKITYNPYLENSWNAIDAVGGWVSAAISGVAIWFAASVPKHIAQEQNKIALFEKRFTSYSVFLKYISFAEMLRDVENINELCQVFSLNFMEYGDVTDLKELILMIKNDEQQLMSGLFLFSNFCNGETVHDILQGVLEVAGLIQCKEIELSKEDKNKILLFYNKCRTFEKDYMEKMRRQLTI